jgi:hypothetical protein
MRGVIGRRDARLAAAEARLAAQARQLEDTDALLEAQQRSLLPAAATDGGP